MKRMGWTEPWYSSDGREFNKDFGATTDEGEYFGISVFLCDDKDVYHTSSTDARGVEYLGSNFSYLDLTPYGRQEDREDSPKGWTKTPRYTWWRHHDRYEFNKKKK